MVPRSLRWCVFAAAACLCATSPAAQRAQLTIEDIYGTHARFSGSFTAGMAWAPSTGPWLSDAQYLWPGRDDVWWMRVDAISGAAEPLVTAAQVEAALRSAGAAPDEVTRTARRRTGRFTQAHDALLVTAGSDLYRYDIAAARATRLTRSTAAKSEALFSPDGRAVAFIEGNNLHVASSAGERALTSDGSPEILNGKLDWVYSEEIYGRGNYRAFWWSPDSRHIAFLQLDERPVPEYTLVDDIPYHPEIDRWTYPKAGDPNPIAKLGVVPVDGGPVRWIDTSKYDDFLIVNVGWTPDSRAVVYQIQNREQTWLDLNRSELGSNTPSTLLRETSRAWVERWPDSSANVTWLRDGSFLWLSERTGWRHLYHYKPDGTLIRQVTRGEWEVRQLHGADPSQRTVFIDTTMASPVDLDLYSVSLDGTQIERLSRDDGHHEVFLNPSRTAFLDSWSDLNTPARVRLFRARDTAPVRIADQNTIPALKEYALSTPERLQVKARDGFVMEAMMIKPPDFDPSRRYPVYQFTYAGPHAQQVVNQWGGSTFMYHQLLAQRGVIVWVMDNRTASGKGVQSAWPLYRNFGETELRDLEDGIAWLKQRPYVDADRIGISGISYGGFMTVYAMTHSRSFAMGIAEGAVTDWRNYDTIYTERYMGLPAENAEGYRRSSPRFDAANLSGRLLLVHSTLDDNVHPQNAMQFAYELQQSGKPFQMMLYPKSAHGVSEASLETHLRKMMLDFTTTNLLR